MHPRPTVLSLLRDALTVALVAVLTVQGLRRWYGDRYLVPTDSMPFGTFLGCVGADHLEEIGQPAGGGLLSAFDHLQMYEDLAVMLRGNHDEG